MTSRPPFPSQPVKWWELISEMEAFRTETGWGLAGIWGMVHRGEYERARARFDTLLAEHRHAFGTELRDWLTSERGCREDREDLETDDGKRRQRRIWRGVGIPENQPDTAETLAPQGNTPDGVTAVTALPETPIETGSYRHFTESPSQPSQDDPATVCEVCDKPGDLVEIGGVWVHDTARCRWQSAGLDPEEVAP